MREGIWDNDSYSGEVSTNEHDFPFIDHNNEDEVQSWLVNDFQDKINSRLDRLEMIDRLDNMFEGEPYTVTPKRRTELDDTNKTKVSIFNYVGEMVESKMSQRARFKSNIQIIPSKIELADENKADSVKFLLTAKGREKDIERVLSEGDKENFIAGESYTYIPWNKYLGGLSRKPVINPMTNEQYIDPITGEPQYSDAFYRGDMDIKVLGPNKAFHQLGKARWEDVDDVSICEWVHIDELKADYPGVADKIQPGASFSSDEYLGGRRVSDQHVLVIEYYRKPTRFLTTGAYYKFCATAVFEGSLDYPFKSPDGLPVANLPVVYDTDIDLRGKMGGKPFTSNIERLQRLHDMISSSVARGFAIGNSPKWIVPKGSVDPNKLNNNYSMLEYRGPMEPKLASFAAVPQGSDSFMSFIERGIEKGSAVGGMARGDIPKSVKSAVALQFLSEQENGRESLGMAKRQTRALAIYKMMLQRAQQFYTPDDERIFKYLGEDNEYLVRSFEKLDITGDFDIYFENSSSLPDTKSGKIASIIDLNQSNPENPLFSNEQIVQMLDLGNDKRFRTEAQASLKAAQSKLQRILEGVDVESMDWDDFATEYPIFVKALRERSYKSPNPEVEGNLIRYITGMEALIFEKITLNPIYREIIIRKIPEYPIFLKLPPVPVPPPTTDQAGSQERAVTEMPSLDQPQGGR